MKIFSPKALIDDGRVKLREHSFDFVRHLYPPFTRHSKDDGPLPLVKTGWPDQSSREKNYTTNEENTVSQISLFLNGVHGSDEF